MENLQRRGSAATIPESVRHAPNAALLIDFDNVTMGIRSDLQIQLKRLLSSEVFKGKISVQRAYADWRRYPQYIMPLSVASIDLIFAPAFGSNKKNATDIRLAIDALELVFTRPEIGTYILLSGDSDFSSLVLKLKEFGKYVIGVGIRESSSDLLIQNCDEYYSYNELTGLLKEGEVEHRRRDPWELVVEALSQMQQHGDVMRSDRLKQVMQELDPNFDEKDAGFSKYSKFLQEASRRGIMRLNKLENGQFEIGLGSNANVSPEVEAGGAAHAAAMEEAAAESRPRRRGGRGGRGERAERVERPRGPETQPAEGLTLAEGFTLIREALHDIGAIGDEVTDADQVRERMVERSGKGDDELFAIRRFQRFLRQAHDAGVIDLVKSDDGIYLLKLRPEQAVPAGAVEGGAELETGDEGDRASRRRRGTRGGRGRRRSGRRPEEVGEGEEREPARGRMTAPEPGEPAPVVTPAPPRPPRSDTPQRNPRFRRGARGAAGPASRPPVVVEDQEPAPSAPAPTGPVEHNRSLRGRRGRRGPGQPAGLPLAAPEAPALPEPRPRPAEPPPARRPDLDEQAKAVRAMAEEKPAAPEHGEADQGPGGSLFKRMSAALQRAMLGQPRDDEPPREP
jgi:uncharacterized protein (TIGR00288 family)